MFVVPRGRDGDKVEAQRDIGWGVGDPMAALSVYH